MAKNRISRIVTAVLIAGLFLTCAVNPVTGKKEFMLISENQEIALGKETDRQIEAMYGFYNDPGLNAYISRVGMELSKVTHRPGLPYSFKVLDTPVINAFAVPGGYIYVTRGILAYFNNEAELAGILGHELGHVNARHTARAMSRAQLAGLGLGVGALLWKDMEKYSGLIQIGVGVLFLKFSRSNEYEADALGVEYASKARYDGSETANFFNTLNRLHPSSGPGALPEFLSTHPNPDNRLGNVRTDAEKWKTELNLKNPKVNRNQYMRQIDGMVFGADPRQGYVESGTFYHPEMKFQFPVPDSWTVNNTPGSVQIISPDQNAAIVLTLSEKSTPAEASAQFTNQVQGIVKSSRAISINRLSAQETIMDQYSQQDSLRIQSFFIKKGTQVYALHGLAVYNQFSKYARDFSGTMQGFRALTEQSKINVKPKRLVLRKTSRKAQLKSLLTSYGVKNEQLEAAAVMNGMELNDTVKAGTILKIVREK